MKITTKQRQRMLCKTPWVTWVEKGQQCDRHWYGPTASKEYRGVCKTPAHYRLKPPRQPGDIYDRAHAGVYCQSHLWGQMHRGMNYPNSLYERLNAYLDEHWQEWMYEEDKKKAGVDQ